MENRTELVFILDKSGSMAGMEADTIGGFNAMLEKQKQVEGTCRVTTVLFDNGMHVLHDRIDLQAVQPMKRADFVPGGCTALLDAVGSTITKLISVQKNTDAPYRADQVLFVIITDGEENASRHYSLSKVRHMIETEQNEYGWKFVFLGANIDAVQTARTLGIDRDMAADYAFDPQGTSLNYQVMSEAVAGYRKSGKLSGRSLDAIRKNRRKGNR